MKIKVENITYNLYDPETNPDNSISSEDYELPSKLIIEQKTIDELYGKEFKMETDIEELINCHTGFPVENFNYEVIS